MSTNKAILVNTLNYESPDVSIAEVPVPEPAAGEALVRLTVRPINPSDMMSIRGAYPGWHPASLPATPGLEGVGVVAKVGEGVTNVTVGQRVVGAPFVSATGDGTWREFGTFKAAALMPVPEDVDDFQAAQFFVNPLTAVGFLWAAERDAGLKQGGWILSNAASSQLGHMLVRLAKKRGYKTVNVVRNAKYVEGLKKAGADAVIVNGEGVDLRKAVNEVTGGEGAAVAFEPVGGSATGPIISAVRDGAVVYVYGALESIDAPISLADLMFRDVRVRGFWLKHFVGALTPSELKETFTQTMRAIADGTLATQPGKGYALGDFKEAFAEAERPGRGDKVFFVSKV